MQANSKKKLDKLETKTRKLENYKKTRKKTRGGGEVRFIPAWFLYFFLYCVA